MTMFDDEDLYSGLFGKKRAPSPKKKSSSTKTRPKGLPPASSRTSSSSRLLPKKGLSSKTKALPGPRLPGKSIAPRLGLGKKGSGWENLTRGYAHPGFQQPGSDIIPYSEPTPFDEGVAEAVPQPIVPESGEELVSPEEGVPEEALDSLAVQALQEMGFGDEDDNVDPIEAEPTDYEEEDSFGAARFSARQLPVPARWRQDLARRREAEEGHVMGSPAPVRYGAERDQAPSHSFGESFVAGIGVGAGFMTALVGIGLIGRALSGK